MIAHNAQSAVPAVHMNTRFVVTTKAWFGGGADLTPMIERGGARRRSDAKAFQRGDAGGLREHPRRRASTSATRNGATSIHDQAARNRAASAAFSSTGTTRANGRRTSPSVARSGAALAEIYPKLVRANFADRPGPRSSARSSWCAGRYVEFKSPNRPRHGVRAEEPAATWSRSYRRCRRGESGT